jgi:hypothetical protein
VLSEPGSLSAVLSELDRRIPPALASATARQRLHEIATGLPATTGTGLECRLKEPDRVDPAQREPMCEPLDRDQEWRKVAWRCYDSDGEGGSYLGPGPVGQLRARDTRLRPWLDALEATSRAEIGAATRATVTRVARQMPSDVGIRQLGSLSRLPPGTVRIVLGGSAPSGLATTLRAVGWHGNYGALGELTDAAANSREVVISLNAHETMDSSLGVELRPAATEDWARLLQRSLRQDSHRLIPALISWKGFDLLASASTREVRNSWRLAVRRLNHLKWSLKPGGGDAAVKAYLRLGLTERGSRR